jgi:two-component system sensor histidine kinase UhpB
MLPDAVRVDAVSLRALDAAVPAAQDPVGHALRAAGRTAAGRQLETGTADPVAPIESAARGGRVAGWAERLSTRYRRTSLYSRVVAINASIVAGATLVLALTPATVGYPIRVGEAAVLVAGVIVAAVSNALLLRISFGALASVVTAMQTVDLVRRRERLPVVGGPETRAVVAGLNQMLDRLEEERRDSSHRTLAALEDERQRIAGELHDEIGQRLTGIVLQLGNLVPDAPGDLGGRIVAVTEQARATLDEIGVLAWQLRPRILDDLGLPRALEALVESFEEHTPSVRIRSSFPAAVPRLAPEAELAAYRIAQEALTNAVRHSDAAQIDLVVATAGPGLRLSVADDGAGRASTASEGAGMRGMRERAFAIGGTLTIESEAGSGVRVELELPRATGGV